MKLYTYWRSTTAYRLRIALNLKGLDYEAVPIDLVAGDQRSDAYMALNPIGAVPSLEHRGDVFTQSMALLEWLEETHAEPAFLPEHPDARAKVRAAANVIATDIHPVNNLKVVTAIKDMGHSQDEIVTWMNGWMTKGFTAVQALIDEDTPFCFGDTPGLADICLIPQLYNAHRWGCDLSGFQRLTEIEDTCLALLAFAAARPEIQPDAG